MPQPKVIYAAARIEALETENARLARSLSLVLNKQDGDHWTMEEQAEARAALAAVMATAYIVPFDHTAGGKHE